MNDSPHPPGYQLADRISAGGSAIVYRARSRRFRDPVALKIWHEPLDAVARERFLREIGVLRALAGDPHVVQILDAGAPPDRPAWLAMELCDESLADRVRRGPVPAAEAFGLAGDLLAGLAALHAGGHLHRDIKPENVLLKDGTAKLGDLGITTPVTALTEHNLAGTGPYLAPELATGQPTVRTDLYAAALVLDRLFEPLELDAVTRLLTRASSSRPTDRPAGADEFRAALAALHPDPSAPPLTHSPPTQNPPTQGPPTQGPPTQERSRRLSPRVAVTAGVVVVLLTALGGWRLMPALDAAAAPAASDTSDTSDTSGATTPSPATAGTATGTPTVSAAASPPAIPSAGTMPGSVIGTSAPAAPLDSRPTPTTAVITATAGPTAAPATRKPTLRVSPAATLAATVKAPDGSACFGTAVTGGFDLAGDTVIAGGPNYTTAKCRDIHIKLTSATYRTYARSCTETSDGGSIVGCSGWILLSYPDTWDTMSTGVADGTRWQLQMRAEDAETVEFQYTE